MWAPREVPATLPPKQAIDDSLWMTAQTVSYSSPDGLSWTEHAKTDWGERIYQTVVAFQDKLWMFGGMDRDQHLPERHLGVVRRDDVAERRDRCLVTTRQSCDGRPRRPALAVRRRHTRPPTAPSTGSSTMCGSRMTG